jgi:hypothetical protein
MTTTAAAWRHVERGWDKACGAPSDVEGFVNCGCFDPTPDATSPCGDDRDGHDLPCGAVASDDWHDRRTWEHDPELWHPHQPTRCERCGHQLEAVR